MNHTDHLIKAKDYIYVIFTPLNTLLTIFGLLFINYWWDQRKRKDDEARKDRQSEIHQEEDARKREMEREEGRWKVKKEDKQREKEREKARQKADTEKIAAVLSKKYDEVERIFHNFKKNVEKLKTKTIHISTHPIGNLTRTFTEFDVLLYMCHLNNMEIFDNTDQQGRSLHALGIGADTTFRSSGYGIKEVISDVNKIMKLFIEFRIQLSSIHDKKCPEDIKSEFSDEIIEMGKTIYPFVSTPRQKVIKKVLRYFGSEAESPNAVTEPTSVPVIGAPNAGIAVTKSTSVPVIGAPNAGIAVTKSTSVPVIGAPNAGIAVTEPTSVPVTGALNAGTTVSPGDNAIKHTIPYINYFRYKNGEMSYNVECKYSCVKYLESCVVRRITGVMEKENEIRDGIKTFWPAQPSEPADQLPEGDLLHLIRMVMFKMLDNSRRKFFNEEHLNVFVEYVKRIVNLPKNLDKDTVKNHCERELGNIENHIKELCRGYFTPVLEEKATLDILHHHAEELRTFVKEKAKKHRISIGTMTQEDTMTIEPPYCTS